MSVYKLFNGWVMTEWVLFSVDSVPPSFSDAPSNEAETAPRAGMPAAGGTMSFPLHGAGCLLLFSPH